MTEGREITFAPELNPLPSPREFRKIVQARVDAEIKRMREERGEVVSPADVYPLVRGLMSAYEQLDEYATALTGVTTSIRQELEEELMAIPGNEQAGIPLGGATVPDIDGTDIKLALQQKTDRQFDVDALVSVAVAEKVTSDLVLDIVKVVCEGLEDESQTFGGGTENGVLDLVAVTVESAVRRVLALGNFTPQVTKVKAYAKEAAGAGDDGSAAVIQGSVRERKVYTGIKAAREARK
ncbi:hypothetical protein AB0383_20235 [Amycolatopsis sp. NPDC051373]|uniref:hypothetical protein n=1 Tax=Amycolatopsis sp. NPDC051373 TaxID=3155801 RepID=UPI00344EC60D